MEVVNYSDMNPYLLCGDISNKFNKDLFTKTFGIITFRNYIKSQVYYNIVSQLYVRDLEDYFKAHKYFKDFESEYLDSIKLVSKFYYFDLSSLLIYCLENDIDVPVSEYDYSILDTELRDLVDSGCIEPFIKEEKFDLNLVLEDIRNTYAGNTANINYDIDWNTISISILSKFSGKLFEILEKNSYGLSLLFILEYLKTKDEAISIKVV